MARKEIIEQIKHCLKHLDISKIILFGSWARGTQKEGSDIDLLVVTRDNFVFQSFAQKMETKVKVADALNPVRKYADIDLIVYTMPMFEQFIELNSNFKKDIFTSGLMIYEANN